MQSLAPAIAMALHLAAASLHQHLAKRFWPDRHLSVQQQTLFLVMVGCAIIHVLVATEYLMTLLELPQYKSVLLYFSEALGILLCAEIIPALMSDYTVLPDNPSRLARSLHKFASQAVRYHKPGLLVAAALSAVMVALQLSGGEAQYPGLRWLHPHYLVALLLGLWLVILWSGLRPAEGVLTFMRAPLEQYLLAVFFCMILVILADGYALKPVVDGVVRFATVPFAILYCWYRYRLELIDVIAIRFARLVVVLLAVGIGAAWVPNIPASIQPVVAVMIGVTGLYGALWVDAGLSRLWMPGKMTREMFRAEFPRELSQCVTEAESNVYCERALARLFQTDVGVNRPIRQPLEIVQLERPPFVRIELGAIKSVYPWFSEALQLVRDAAQFLRAHLQVLELQGEQHRQLMTVHELSELAAHAELQAMRAQIRPHFLFNVLNTIHSFIREAPEQAEKTIELLAGLMRGVVQSSVLDRYPLRRELELAETYLQIERIRFGERLSYYVQVDPEWLEELVPPFSVQPLVENAVKFSIDEQLGQAKVSLEVVDCGGTFEVRVKDNGPGPDAAGQAAREGLGVALENIRERLGKLYGDRAGLSLEALPEGGTMAVLSIPVESQRERVTA